MFEELWNHQASALQERARSLKTELARIESEKQQFLDRIVRTDVPSVISAYEERIQRLDERKALTAERIAKCGRPVGDFDESLRTALLFLGNPSRLQAVGFRAVRGQTRGAETGF
jgi:DNA repair exonuclease SbcCD ATPase subunit